VRNELVWIAVPLTALLAGCTMWPARESDQAVLRMVGDVRHQAAQLPESPEKENVVRQLASLESILAGGEVPDTQQLVTTADWYDLFGPKQCDLLYFTDFADFDGDGAVDGLNVFVELKDAFGDPVKVLGRFRIETFTYVSQAIDHRGGQVSNWVVNVFSTDDVRRYYHSTRGFLFPLAFAAPPEADRLIVQVTYYLPDGSGRKIFGERLVKARDDSGR
jgi:hypothetical protein